MSVATATHKIRAELLAHRIEEGAERLAAFAEGLSEAQWKTLMSASIRPSSRRSPPLELLQKNSREAAAAVRAFTDEELDPAAPFSLSFAAPVTAQFVIEDHARQEQTIWFTW